jgi:hypothetical protein
MGTGSNVPLITGATQGLAEAAGAVTQARAVRAKGDFDLKSLQMARSIEELRARDIRRRGRQLEQRHRQQVRKLIGSQRAAFAAQGIDVGAGSAFALQLETAELGALDALMIRTNAEREAMGVELGIEGLRTQERVSELAAETEFTTTLLTGGLQAARSIYRGTMDYYKLNPPRGSSDGFRARSRGLPPPGATSLFDLR